MPLGSRNSRGTAPYPNPVLLAALWISPFWGGEGFFLDAMTASAFKAEASVTRHRVIMLRTTYLIGLSGDRATSLRTLLASRRRLPRRTRCSRHRRRLTADSIALA